jgi:hypothetical protein
MKTDEKKSHVGHQEKRKLDLLHPAHREEQKEQPVVASSPLRNEQ